MEIIKIIFKYIMLTIVFIVLILNVDVIVKKIINPNSIPSIFGYKTFIVLSDSMEPNIMSGDLIFTKDVAFSSLKENDIIAFRNKDEKIVTHRIKAIDEKNPNCFITKGDANNIKDEGVVCANKIEGKYVRRIAYLGSIFLVFQNPFVISFLVIFVVVGGITWFMLDNKMLILSNNEEFEEYEDFKEKKKKRKIRAVKKKAKKEKEEK